MEAPSSKKEILPPEVFHPFFKFACQLLKPANSKVYVGKKYQYATIVELPCMGKSYF